MPFEKHDVLLIVDPQYDFFPEGALGVPFANEIIPVINAYLAAAQAAHIPIIVSRDWHPKDHCSFRPQGGIWPPHCVQNTSGAKFHRDIALPDDMIIINKATEKNKEAYSAMAGMTDKEGLPTFEKLQQLQTQTLWIAGLALDYCVQATALEARAMGFKVNVLLPGCRAIAPEKVQVTLDKMKQAGIQLVEKI